MRNELFVVILCWSVFLLFIGCTKVNTQKLTPSDGTESLGVINQTIPEEGSQSELFGNDVDVDDVYAVVGDPGYDDLFLTNRGRIHIYGRASTGSTWTERAALKDPNPKVNGNFGYFTAISGNYAVSATYDSIYVFKRTLGDIWVKEAALFPANLAADSLVLSDIDIYGDYIVAGHGSRNINGKQHCGAVYFFKRINSKWAYQSTVVSPNNEQGDRFGSSVSIHGNYALIGSRGNYNATHGGKAYVFLQFLGNWNLQATLTSSDVQLMDNYGCSVDLRGEYAVIGASQESSSGQKKGSAYIFKRTGATWAKQAKLLSSDGLVSGLFGKSVAINNNYAIIGGGGNGHINNGAIYTFNRSGTNWNFIRKDNSPSPDLNYFGWKLAMDSTRHYVVGNFGAISFGTVY